MKFLLSKSFWAKALGWLGGALGLFAAADKSSPYAAVAAAAAPIIGGWGIHLASQTSAQPQVKP